MSTQSSLWWLFQGVHQKACGLLLGLNQLSMDHHAWMSARSYCLPPQRSHYPENSVVLWESSDPFHPQKEEFLLALKRNKAMQQVTIRHALQKTNAETF